MFESQNTFGVSEVNSVAAKSKTIEVNGDHLFKCIKTREEKKLNCLCTAPMMSSKCS